MSEEMSMGRRSFLRAGLAAGVSALALGGCAQGGAEKAPEDEFDWASHYLPLGSVVTRKQDAGAGPKWMIVGRRLEDPDAPGGGKHDYAAVLWPFGFMWEPASDTMLDCYFLETDEIEEVACLGFRDEEERRCRQALEDAAESPETSAEALGDLLAGIAGRHSADEEG